MQSAAISWWNAALQGTTIGSLHRIWDFSTSIVSSIMAGKSVDAIALARILTTAVLINVPLLQRASTIVPYNKTEQVTLSMQVAKDVDSLRKANFSSRLTNIDGDLITLSPALSLVMQQYANVSSIIPTLTGCNGICSAIVPGAGISFDCSITAKAIPMSYDSYSNSYSATLFSSAFDILQTEDNGFDPIPVYSFNVSFAENMNEGFPCYGRFTTVTGNLQHATVLYPVMINNGTVTHQEKLGLNFTSEERVQPLGSNSSLYPAPAEPVFAGLGYAMNNISQAKATIKSAGDLSCTSTGSHATDSLQNTNTSSCALNYKDPTQNIISALNEIMFRIAVTAHNNTSAAQQIPAFHFKITAYQTHYTYMTAAVVLVFAGVIAVTADFKGWQYIGRPVSLSPLETAKAFDAPILRLPNTSNADIKHLLQATGSIRVKCVAHGFRDSICSRKGHFEDGGSVGGDNARTEDELLVRRGKPVTIRICASPYL